MLFSMQKSPILENQAFSTLFKLGFPDTLHFYAVLAPFHTPTQAESTRVPRVHLLSPFHYVYSFLWPYSRYDSLVAKNINLYGITELGYSVIFASFCAVLTSGLSQHEL